MTAEDLDLPEIARRIYNISLRMLMHPENAEDATGDIIVKVIENIPEFREECRPETWIHRIAVNHLLNIRNRHPSVREISFDKFGEDLASVRTDDTNLEASVTEAMELEELKIGCTNAMLQCLSPDERMIFILGEIFSMNSSSLADILGLTAATARKRLSRTRSRIQSFMKMHCGLMNPEAECSCRRRLPAAMKQGRVNPKKLIYTRNGETLRLRNLMEEVDGVSAVYRDSPWYQLPDSVRQLVLKSSGISAVPG